jgi:hypothetical protein
MTVEITEVGSPEARREFTLPDGRKALEGRTLREWLDLFGGPRGQLDSPAGKVDVDLSEWVDHDLDTTGLTHSCELRRPKEARDTARFSTAP